tara:strand:+ start:7134 stop:7370 length:237 start_codon:yes stop_codon:yes gene_type:complete
MIGDNVTEKKKVDITPEVYQKMQEEFIKDDLAFRITIPTQEEIDRWQAEIPVPTPPVHNHDMVAEMWEEHRKKELDKE